MMRPAFARLRVHHGSTKRERRQVGPTVWWVANWNATGYDLSRRERWLYAFLTVDGIQVKVGLVLTKERLAGRLREVARKNPGLTQVAATPLRGVTHQEAEHIESVVRHWLCASSGFDHSGLVDWLNVPDPPPEDWQALLDGAVAASLTFGRPIID